MVMGCIIWLVTTEIRSFLDVEIVNELCIDDSSKSAKVKKSQNKKKMNISFDVMFEKAPCAILGVEAMDVLGNHKTALKESITKRRWKNSTQEYIGHYKSVIYYFFMNIRSIIQWKYIT